ncbi:hypothetical protein L596_006562 [Steinernema carpocapsae]|uniref:Uncharacterized protein n=1 Tax=Steinernema carpocapsae TaxID=34508 RepID=A0A4V6I8U3_STECR|nr:hypothetical protein L596_006562 [Steinernema carpocapsae]
MKAMLDRILESRTKFIGKKVSVSTEEPFYIGIAKVPHYARFPADRSRWFVHGLRRLLPRAQRVQGGFIAFY